MGVITEVILPKIAEVAVKSSVPVQLAKAVKDYGTDVVSQWVAEPTSSDPNAHGSIFKQLANVAGRKENLEALGKRALVAFIPLGGIFNGKE